MFRATPSVRAITLIGSPSARCSLRISAQSSTDNTPPPPGSDEPGLGRVGCDLRIAVDLPPRGASGEGQVRYVKAVAFGVLASHAAESVRKGDRVIIQGHDLTAEG